MCAQQNRKQLSQAAFNVNPDVSQVCDEVLYVRRDLPKRVRTQFYVFVFDMSEICERYPWHLLRFVIGLGLQIFTAHPQNLPRELLQAVQ